VHRRGAAHGGIGDGSRLHPAPTPESDVPEAGNYAKRAARREGFDGSLRSLVESANSNGRNGAPRGIREQPSAAKATQPLGRCAPTRHSLIPRDSPSGSRASFARDAHRQRSWLAKKNPNLRKINDLRSSDRHMAAYSGISRHPGRHSTPKTAPRRHWIPGGWLAS
jgi:hypothetical protein